MNIAVRLTSAVILAAFMLWPVQARAGEPSAFDGVDPADPLDLLVMGADRQYRGDPAGAANYFKRVLRIEPENEYAMNQLALSYARQEQYAMALELFRKVSSVSPENTFSRIWEGVLLLGLDQGAEAVERFERVLEIDPNNADAHYFLGVVRAVERDQAGALAHFRKAQRRSGRDARLSLRLAGAFRAADMPRNAVLEYAKALAIEPGLVRARNDMGWVLYNQGERDAAVQAWLKNLEINPSDPRARANLAKVLGDEALRAERKGDPGTAAGLWRKVLGYDPGNRAARYHLRKAGARDNSKGGSKK